MTKNGNDNESQRAFAKFVKRPELVKPQPQDVIDVAGEIEELDDKVYRAYKVGQQGRPQLRLRLYDENGVISLMTYSYLTEAVTGSHQFLSLVFTNCIFDLYGRNLPLLLDKLQDARIRALYCYHKEKFPEPAENEPVIYSIRRQALYEATGAEQANGGR